MVPPGLLLLGRIGGGRLSSLLLSMAEILGIVCAVEAAGSTRGRVGAARLASG
jgi:hypothetical protein